MKYEHMVMLCLSVPSLFYGQVVEDFGVDNPLTRLVVDLTGIHPDDAFSSVPYEKGSALLYTLEQAVGGAGEINI